MSFYQKLPILQRTEFPTTDVDIVIKYFTMTFPPKTNLLLIILKKLNLIKSLSKEKTSTKIASLSFQTLNSSFSLSNLTKRDIESIEQNLSSGHIFKPKEVKHKLKNDSSEQGVVNLFKLDTQFSEFKNNTEHFLLFLIMNNFIDYFESPMNDLSIFDFIKTIEPLFVYLFRYFIRIIYHFKSVFTKDDLIIISNLVIRTFLRLSSLFDQQNQQFEKNAIETFSEADHDLFNLYDVETHKLLSDIFYGLNQYLQSHENEDIIDKTVSDLFTDIEQFSCSFLQKRHTMLPLFPFSTTSTTPFITFEIHQFLLLSSLHRTNLCFNHNFSNDELNQVIYDLVSLLVIDPQSQSFKELEKKMIDDGQLMNSYDRNSSIILFGPFLKISEIAFNYIISISSEKVVDESKMESVYRFCSFMLSSMTSVIEKAPKMSDYCSDVDLYSLSSSYLITIMKSFASEILNKIKTSFEKDISNIAEIHCNCEFEPFFKYEPTIKDYRIRNLIFLPKNDDIQIKVSGSTKDYISECAESFNIPEYHSKIAKQSPRFDKLLTIHFKQNKNSLFLRNVLMKLTSMILTDYSSFAITIDESKDYSENTLMLFFLINLILVSSNETSAQLFKVFDLLNIFTNLFVFDEKYFPLIKDKNYSRFNPANIFLYLNLQYSVMTFINRNFRNFPSEIVELILTKIDTSNSLEIANIFQVLLNEVYAANIPEFLNYGMNNEHLFPVLVKYVAKMRVYFYKNANKYAEIKNKNEKIDPELLKGNLKNLYKIHECRKKVMLFLILLTLESNTIFCLYSNECPVLLMADESFEVVFSKIALDFLCHGLQIIESNYHFESQNPHKLPLTVVTRVIMRLLLNCVKQSERNPELRMNYLNLLYDVLLNVTNAAQINQQSLISAIVRCNFLPLLFSIPERLILHLQKEKSMGENRIVTNAINEISELNESCSTLEDLQIDILDQVIYIVCALAKGNNEFKKVVYKHLLKFASFLRKIKLQDTTINSLLQLLFEKVVDLHNLPEISEILFNNALIIIHTALEKDYKHYLLIFDYILQISRRSYANRLHLFQANFSHFIINYIANQNKQNTLTFETQKDRDDRFHSIEVLWDIYQCVSADLYKPSTFVNMFYLMKVKNKRRHWYTSRILSIFDTILSNKFSQKTASSYFHFSGNKSGIYVPRIDLSSNPQQQLLEQQQIKVIQQDSSANEIADGSWSFCCLFLIDNIVYEYSIRNSCLMSFTSQSTSISATSHNAGKKIAQSKMKLVIEPPHIFFVFESPAQNVNVIEKLPCKFRPCVWYHLVLTISNLKYVKIYVNGTKYFHKNIAQLDLSPVLENFSVANSFSCPFSINSNYNTLSQRNQRTREITEDIIKNISSDNDSSLICNLACCYLFCKKLSGKVVSEMANLPYDFVYSFISSNQNLFHNLPESLFTGEIEQSLVFCYNAKLCENQNVCINLKRNGKVGNAIFSGDIVPYNLTSITSFGGLKIFLPLFDQVDYPIDYLNDISHIKEDTEIDVVNERKQFLVVLLNIFAYCIRLSNEVETMFCNENGIQALSYALSSLHPDDWSTESFKSLHQLFTSLRYDSNKMDMVMYILFNPRVWNKLSVKSYDNYKETCILSVLNANKTKKDQELIGLLTKYAGFTHLLIEILEKKNDELRNVYWSLIVTYARLGLVKPNETKRLFLFAFADDSFYYYHDVKYINQIQALKSLYRIVANKYSDFHIFLTSPNNFNNIMLLSQSESEVIRIYGLKLLLLIKDYIDAKIIIEIPPIPISQALPTYLSLLNTENISEYSWNELLKMAFKEDGDNKLVSLILPFISIISSSINPDLIVNFGKDILQKISLSLDHSIQTSKENLKDTNFCELLSSSQNWAENLFYICIQSSSPFDFAKCDDENYKIFVQIYAKMFTYFLMNDKNANFASGLNSLNLIQYFTKWDISIFVRLILIEMMKILNTYISSLKDDKLLHNSKNDFENLYANMISTTFTFLMVVPSYEIYTNNLELFKLCNTEPTNQRVLVLNEKVGYKDFIEFHTNQQIVKTNLNCTFAPRFDENGNWVDIELAELFSTALSKIFKLHLDSKNYNFGAVTIFSKTTKIIDIYTLNEMFLMKSLKKSLKETIDQKFVFLAELTNQSQENIILSLSIIIYFSFVTLNTNEDNEDHKKFNEIAQIIQTFVKSHEVTKKSGTNTNNNDNSNSEAADSESSIRPEVHNSLDFASEKANEFITAIISRQQTSTLNLSKNYTSLVSNLISIFKAKTSKITVPPTDSEFFDNTLHQYIETLSHFSGVCEAAFKSLRRDVLKNSGLWKSTTSDPLHWKLSPYLDNEFRHNIMEPNHHYTDHIDASIRRDVGDESIAKVKIAEISQLKEANKAKKNKNASDLNLEDNNNNNTNTNKNDSNQEAENETAANKTYIINTQARLVTIEGIFSGYLSLNGKELFFSGTLDDEDDFFTDSSSSTIIKDSQRIEESREQISNRPKKSIEISLKNIVMVLLRNYLHIQSAFEIFLTTKRSYFIFLPNNDRKNVFRFLVRQNMPNLKYFQLSPEQNSFINEFRITEKWQRKKISNYEYLLLLNLCAGRSFNDLSQYPVFPWVLTNYKSEELDMKDLNNFRDLSKPLGTLNPERLEKLKFSCENRPEEELPPFLYRLHYSTAYNVTAFMIRIEPYTSIYLKLNGGRFDIKERIFNSIGQIWDAVTSYQNEFRELIPEVYTTPEIFMNDNKIDLGGTNKADQVKNNSKNKKFRSEIELIIGDDSNSSLDYYKGVNDFLLLPPWANSNPFYFVSKHREALESDYVSMHLNEWIDLIFGYKQMGEEAEKANNTFHPYSYPSFVTPQVLKDKELMRDIQLKIRDFGITPFQIFKNDRHPCRFEAILESTALSGQPSGPISFIASIFRRKSAPKIPRQSNKNNTTNSTVGNNNVNANPDTTTKITDENISSSEEDIKPFFSKHRIITSFSRDNRPVFVSSDRKIIVLLTVNAHLYVFKKLHKKQLENASTTDSTSKKNKSKNANNESSTLTNPEFRYTLLSLHDISQFVTFTELKSRRLKNCCTMYNNIIVTSNGQKQKMTFFIVSAPDDISFHIFSIDEDNGSVFHITSSHEQAIIKHIISAPNSTAFMASSKDTSISCFMIKGEGKNNVFGHHIPSQPVDIEIPSPLELVGHVITATSAITSFLASSNQNGPHTSNGQLVSCSAVPSVANVSIEMDKTFRILTHSAPIVDLYESSTENLCISADETNKIIFTNINDGSYIRSLIFAKLTKVKVVLNDKSDPSLAKFFKSSTTTNTPTTTTTNSTASSTNSTFANSTTKVVTLNARQFVRLVMITDDLPCALIASIVSVFMPNPDSNLKLNGAANSNSNVNTSGFSTSGLFSTGPQYLLTQDENSLILSDLKSNLLASNESNEEADSNINNNNNNNDISEMLNSNFKDEESSIDVSAISNVVEKVGDDENNHKKAENEINNSDTEIDTRIKSSQGSSTNFITRTVLYSYDLDCHLINYRLVDSKIISWCEVKSNASSKSKLVVAFSNKTLCAYSLPCLEMISSIDLDGVPIMIHYNEERNKLIIVQEGNEYSISDLNLGEQ